MTNQPKMPLSKIDFSKEISAVYDNVRHAILNL